MFDQTSAAWSARSSGVEPSGRDRDHARGVQPTCATLGQHGMGVVRGRGGDVGGSDLGHRPIVRPETPPDATRSLTVDVTLPDSAGDAR